MKNPLREILNKLIWNKDIDKSNFLIAFISRGVKGNLEIMKGDSLFKVTKDYAHFKTSNGIKDIPFHRIVYVYDKKNKRYVYYNPHK